MAKSVKLKDNYFIDSTGIVHEKGLLSTLLNSILTKINAENTIKELTLPSVAVTTATTMQVGSYTITEAGTYLISGNISLNYYGQEGRSMHVQLKKNGEEFYSTTAVYNTYAWTVSQVVSHMVKLAKGDVITIHIGSSSAKNWSCGEGKIQFLKL